ncbi:Tor complex Tor2 interacting protein 1 [Ancistrocladus abbreviatus]
MIEDSGIDPSKEGRGWRGGRGGGRGDGDGGGVGGCGGVSTKDSDPFIDRSKVRILLCDNDMKSAKEVLELLCKCSYQVTSVRSARQLIDALNAEGPDIDIILTEVDLPMKKGMKMLKYITRNKELQRIPVIMMSGQDEVSIVVKCLRLGAADYLVKPLRTNELLNLWTHMWRRRHMLGLAEKNILNYDFDLAASDPSDANTNSTTLFSDDTDDKSRKSVNPDMSLPTNPEDETNNASQEPAVPDSLDHQPDVPGISDQRTGQFQLCPKKSKLKIGAMNQVMMPPSAQLYQKNLHDIQNHTTAMMPHYNHFPHCPSHVSGMASFPYYPMGICLQPGQMPAAHQWPSLGSSTAGETKADKVDRREAALMKFRRKRKERCFDKKIRYVNRKRLAERRPRLRGQFVRKVNGVMVDLNGEPSSADLEEYDEDDENHLSRDSSPDDDAS